MGIKKYNAYTPSRRHMTGSDFKEITKDTPEKSLVVSLNKNAGRNNQGKITVRHRGGGNEIVRVEQKYRYSDVEVALYRRIVEYFVLALKDGFSNYINVSFKIQRVEENPSMVQEVGLDETVAIVHLNVDVAGLAVEKIKLCIPGTLLEFIFHLIDSRKHIARGFAYEDNKEALLDHIRFSPLPITGQLGTVELGLRDLAQLQVGDVISLNKPKDSHLKVFVGRQPWFTGKMGVYKKNVAIRIEDRIYAGPEKERDKEILDE